MLFYKWTTNIEGNHFYISDSAVYSILSGSCLLYVSYRAHKNYHIALKTRTESYIPLRHDLFWRKGICSSVSLPLHTSQTCSGFLLSTNPEPVPWKEISLFIENKWKRTSTGNVHQYNQNTMDYRSGKWVRAYMLWPHNMKLRIPVQSTER